MNFLFPAKKSKYFDAIFKCLKEGLENQSHSIKRVLRKDLTENLIKDFDFTFIFTVTSDVELKKVLTAGSNYIYLDKGYVRNQRLRKPEAFLRFSPNAWQPLKYLDEFSNLEDRWSYARKQTVRKYFVKNPKWVVYERTLSQLTEKKDIRECKRKFRSEIYTNRSGKQTSALPRNILHYETLEPRPTEKENQGSYILFAGSSAKYHMFMGLENPETYAKNVISELRKYTNRPVIYRPKPTWSGREPIPQTIYMGDSDVKYHQLMNYDIHSVITHTSNAALEANFYGIPTLVLGDSIAKPVSSTKLKDIENIYMPTLEEKESLGRSFSYFQYQMKEISTGLPWKKLKHVLEGELDGS
jgi:hypothetical protein